MFQLRGRSDPNGKTPSPEELGEGRRRGEALTELRITGEEQTCPSNVIINADSAPMETPVEGVRQEEAR